jgi:hypothetical protein
MQIAATYTLCMLVSFIAAEFISRDALLPEYHEQKYDPDIDELRQRGLVWEHDGINPKDFESCLKEIWNNRSPVPLDMIDDNDMFL